MYLEYHYVIAVILLSVLIAGLLVRWRYKKQIWAIIQINEETIKQLEIQVSDEQGLVKRKNAVLEKAITENNTVNMSLLDARIASKKIREELEIEKESNKAHSAKIVEINNELLNPTKSVMTAKGVWGFSTGKS